MKRIDLRSDTVTQPTPEMRKAMMQAEVGDDVYADDPTINELEAYAADLFGKKAAVFAPTGTQSNLIGIMAHCQRGDEYLVGQQSHTYKWEGGGAAVLGSIQPQPVDFADNGTICLQKLKSYIKPIDYHCARTTLLCLENTYYGKALPMQYLKDIAQFCKETHLSAHLDGARIFNAAVKLSVSVRDIAQHFDTVSFCLSKGLGAPIGSMLCGSKELIYEARRWRKVVGGGMRQSGILAAAGLYALKHNVARLADDHAHAQLLTQGLSNIEELVVEMDPAQTNMVFVTIKNNKVYALQAYLKTKNIILLVTGDRVRLVTHLDITKKDILKVVDEFKQFFSVQHKNTEKVTEHTPRSPQSYRYQLGQKSVM